MRWSSLQTKIELRPVPSFPMVTAGWAAAMLLWLTRVAKTHFETASSSLSLD